MRWHHADISVRTAGRGLIEITHSIEAEIARLDIQTGMACLTIQHTSASLMVTENADPAARQDVLTFLEKIAPDGQKWHIHTIEGPDDSPSHMRSVVTETSLTIPIDDGRLTLGTWQGIFVAEHRHRPHLRRISVRILAILESA